MDQPATEIRFVSRQELLQLFDFMLSHYDKMDVQFTRVRNHERLASPTVNQPPGTLSIMEVWLLPGTKTVVAMVHFFLRPDGTLGASGKFDPKRVVHDGIDYRVRELKN